MKKTNERLEAEARLQTIDVEVRGSSASVARFRCKRVKDAEEQCEQARGSILACTQRRGVQKTAHLARARTLLMTARKALDDVLAGVEEELRTL